MEVGQVYDAIAIERWRQIIERQVDVSYTDGREARRKSIDVDTESYGAEDKTHVMPPVSMSMRNVLTDYPPHERREGEDGFRTDEHTEEKEIGVQPSKVGRGKTADGSQCAGIDDHTGTGHPPQETLPPCDVIPFAEIVHIYIQVRQHYH